MTPRHIKLTANDCEGSVRLNIKNNIAKLSHDPEKLNQYLMLIVEQFTPILPQLQYVVETEYPELSKKLTAIMLLTK